jgi:hypothetical protein
MEKFGNKAAPGYDCQVYGFIRPPESGPAGTGSLRGYPLDGP